MAEALAVILPKRPFAVWLIFLFIVAGASWTLLGFVLIYAGKVPLNEVQKAYFANLTIFDHASTVVVGAINLAAAVFLFRLSRRAIPLFAAALVLNLGLTTRAVLGSNWTRAIGAGGLLGACLGLLTALAILLYAVRLSRRGILH